MSSRRVSMIPSLTFKEGSSIVPAINMRSMSRMGMRRSSYGFKGISGVGKMAEKSTMIGHEFKRPALIYLNTYQLNPLERFHPPAVIKAANDALDELFGEHKYNSHDTPSLVLRIAGTVMKAVKEMSFNRYRVISVVTIGQKRSQSYNNTISFLWDHERDNYINVTRGTSTAFVQVTIFGVYLD